MKYVISVSLKVADTDAVCFRCIFLLMTTLAHAPSADCFDTAEIGDIFQ